MNVAVKTKKPSVAAMNIKSFISSPKFERIRPAELLVLEPLGLDQRVEEICEQTHRKETN